MLKVATIGSSWITEQFIQAAQLTNLYELTAVYSRSKETAQDLASVYKAEYYTDELNNIFFDPEIDVIYIASPNILHFEQAKRALKAGKHVIIEKPMITNTTEWHALHEIAEKNNVFIFEAALHIQNRNYHRLKQLVRNKLSERTQPFLGANFNIGQYSSRYLRYLDNIEKGKPAPNVFNLNMAGGTLMDMGVYPIYVAMDLFGLPKTVRYQAQTGPNGVDLFGHIMLTYHDFMVNIFISKAVHSIMPSEIYIEDETIVIHEITRISQVDLVNAAGEKATIINYRPENVMYDELVNFAEVMNRPEDRHLQLVYEDWKQLSLQVAQTMELVRKSARLEIATTLEDK